MKYVIRQIYAKTFHYKFNITCREANNILYFVSFLYREKRILIEQIGTPGRAIKNVWPI